MVSPLAVVVVTLSFFAIIAEGALTYGTGAGGLLPGNQVPPVPAGPIGSAIVTFQKIPGMAMYNVYFQITQTGLTNITLSHIHAGNSKVSGPVVISFTPAINFTSFQTDGLVSGLVQAPVNVVSPILKKPGNFYVNVHTAAYSAGAIRAQLSKTSMTPASVPYNLYVEPLTTAADNVSILASGSSTISIYTLPSKMTYVGFAISVVNITDLTMAHIHMGAAGVNGPVVVPFTPAINFTNFDATAFAYGAVLVDPMLAANITANPAGFYVNVHSVTYPNGVIRGQLSSKAGALAPASSPMSAASMTPGAAPGSVTVTPPTISVSASMVTKPTLSAVFVTMMALLASFA